MIKANLNIIFKSYSCCNVQRYSFSNGPTLLTANKIYKPDGAHLEWDIGNPIILSDDDIFDKVASLLENFEDNNFESFVNTYFKEFIQECGQPFAGNILGNNEAMVDLIYSHLWNVKEMRIFLTSRNRDLIRKLSSIYEAITATAHNGKINTHTYIALGPSGWVPYSKSHFLCFAIKLPTTIYPEIAETLNKCHSNPNYIPKELLDKIKEHVLESIMDYITKWGIEYVMNVDRGKLSTTAIVKSPTIYYLLKLLIRPSGKKEYDRQYQKQPFQKLNAYFRSTKRQKTISSSQYELAKKYIEQYRGNNDFDYKEVKQEISRIINPK